MQNSSRRDHRTMRSLPAIPLAGREIGWQGARDCPGPLLDRDDGDGRYRP